MRHILYVLALIVPSFALAQPLAGPVPSTNGTLINPTITGGTATNTNISASSITPTGASVSLTAAKLASQQGILLDTFKQVGDPDDTASFTRAVSAGVPILCGPKTYSIHDFNTGAVANFVLRGVTGCVIQRNAGSTGTFFGITAANVVIDGVTFDANSSNITANQWGVRLSGGGQNVSIRNSVFKNNSGSIGACLTLSGTGPTGGGNFDIANNEITNCTLQALYINSASNGKISGNWVHDVSGFGIFIGGSSSLPSTDIIVNENRVFRSASTGISFGGIGPPFTFGSTTALRIAAINNVLQDNTLYGISLECDYCDAVGNFISQSSPSVTVLGAIDTLERYGKIQNNTIVFSGINYAIDVGGSQGMLIEGNHVTMTQGSAFNTGGNLNSTIRGNVAYLSGTAFGVTNYATEGTGGGLAFPTQSSNTTIEDNTFVMTGSSTVGVAVFDNAGGYPGNSPNTIRHNKFNVTGSGIYPGQAIQWRGGQHAIRIDDNLWNGIRTLFADPTGSDIIFDWVNLGGLIQGISSTTDIRSIIPRDIGTYGGGGSVLYVTPTAGGSNYVQATTTLSFSGTGCTGQAASPQVNNGAIVGVKMSSMGSGCSGAVTVTANDTSGGSGATFTAGTIPGMPESGTIQYQSVTIHTLLKSGGYMSLLPQFPLQLNANNGIITLMAHYGAYSWDIVSYVLPTFAIGSLPTCGTNNNGAVIRVTGATSSAWEARCNGTNWIAPSGSTIS